MIAIPLEQNHDLLLELESVQRGILYHCPLLIEACVAPVVMRMPLLLIDTAPAASGGNSTDGLFGSRRNRNSLQEDEEEGEDQWNDKDDGSLLTSRDPITQKLHRIVNEVVQELIYTRSNNNGNSNNKSGDYNTNDDDDDDDDVDREGINKDQIRPVMLKFQGLEIDGKDNEILHAIGTEDGATPLLRQVVEEIAKRVETQGKGWKAYLPDDRPQGKRGGLDGDGRTWRPRIPFMRLPIHYWDNLPPPPSSSSDDEQVQDQGEYYVRTPEEGGNGISPIFWYKWWDDRLCNGKGVRIRELAVYGRTGPMGTSEQAFYIPHLRTQLPSGNAVLQREEKDNAQYDKMRRSEQEMKLDNDDFNMTDEEQRFEKQMANFKSTADRRMLETVYDLSPSEADKVDEIADSLREESMRELEEMQEKLESNISNDSDSIIDIDIDIDSDSDSNSDNNRLSNVDATIKTNSKTEEIIRSIAKPVSTGEWSTYSEKKKNKPSPEDNPILQNWKNRKVMAMADSEINTPRKILSPYPSNEHFAGIWSIVSTPTGTIANEQDYLGGEGDPSSNENLILRIDGSIAGGPILDAVNRHRAAGGNWKFFQAEWCGESDDNNANPSNRGIQTRLRIRLVIPPSKTKVLVMEGEVKRGGKNTFSVESVSRENARELFSSSSFRMNRIADDGLLSKNDDDESYLYVSGEAWVEDVHDSDKQKRSKLGRFAMVKNQNRRPDQYSYTIPPPTRYQD
eukprot:CAMPEP_0176500174 /NCGR_PEP_ID=MMETSP0200_2-20121128/13372_1 /TAXON_ID=947934 /ORGANISM="Chaetoceros sp., Strain GSL56" /LENGTH=735 /DNA_ID=CAMNT_0017898747 /DNA_START=327 /DNA_END=2534 /DNA_ORIENTATION=-